MDTVMSLVLREANSSLAPSTSWPAHRAEGNSNLAPSRSWPAHRAEGNSSNHHHQSTNADTSADQHSQFSPFAAEGDMDYPLFGPETGIYDRPPETGSYDRPPETGSYDLSPEGSFQPGFSSAVCLVGPDQAQPHDESHVDVDSPLARLSFSRSSSPAQAASRLPSPRQVVMEARHPLEEEGRFEARLKPDSYLGDRSTQLDTFGRDYFRQDDRLDLDLDSDHQVVNGYLGTNRPLHNHQQHNGLAWSPNLRREVAMHDVNSVANSLDSFDYLVDGNVKYEDSDYSNASADNYTARYTAARSQNIAFPHSQDNTQCSFTQSLSQAASPHTWSASASPLSQAATDSARASPIDPEDSQDKFGEEKLGKSKNKGGMKPRGAQNLPPCRVCGNMASGLHFGVNTCEACNEFFRRSLKRGATYYCSRNRECQVYGKKRNACSFCRYQRCVQMGMSRDAIKTGRYSHKTRTEYAMEVEKVKLKEVNRAETEKHQVLVADLVKYHDKYVKVTTRVPDGDLLANQNTYLKLYRTQRELERRHPPLKAAPQNQRLLDDWKMEKEDLSLTMHDAEMTEHWLRNYINFAKNVPGFKELALSDQASLVRGSWFEFWFLGAFRGYNNDLQVVAYPNGRCFHREEIQKVFGEEYTDFSFYLAERMRSLEVTPEVMVLIKTVCLTFPDRTALENKQAVDRMHWSLVSCLLHTLEKEATPASSAASFPLVVSKLVELRTLTEIAMRAHKSALFQDVLKDSPLLCEMVDTKTRYVATCANKNGPQVSKDP